MKEILTFVLIWSTSALVFVESAEFNPNYNEDEANYGFSWSVYDEYSGNDYGHSENRLGSDITGEYHVLLPDGRVQTVRYNVDPYSGYQARVIYGGDKKIIKTPKPEHLLQSASSYDEAITFIPGPKKVPDLPEASRSFTPYATRVSYLPPASQPKYFAPEAKLPPIYEPVATFTNEITQPRYNYQQASASVNYPVYYRQQKSKADKNDLNVIKTTPSFKSHAHDKDAKFDKDPYLRTEAELSGKNFDQPFYYPKNKKILGNKNRKQKAATRHDDTLFYKSRI